MQSQARSIPMQDVGPSSAETEPDDSRSTIPPIALLAIGRRGPVKLGIVQGQLRAVKVFDSLHPNSSSPPHHPHVNRVHKRIIKGQRCIEGMHAAPQPATSLFANRLNRVFSPIA